MIGYDAGRFELTGFELTGFEFTGLELIGLELIGSVASVPGLPVAVVTPLPVWWTAGIGEGRTSGERKPQWTAG
jgi:hypothetical protein